MAFFISQPTTPAPEPRRHHEFSPSRLEQFFLCPGAYHMQKNIPEQPSEAAAEGTMLHAAVATGKMDGLTDEQKDLVQQCLDFREQLMREYDMRHYGSEVHLQVFKDDKLLTEGWADDVLVRCKEGTNIVEHCIVIDYKFGWTPVTPADANIQAGGYCSAAMLKFCCESSEAYIFQPRIHKTTNCRYTDAPAMIDNIEQIIEKAKSENLILRPSEAACRYCRARLACPAFRMKFQGLAASKGTVDMTNPKVLEALYDASKDVKSFLREIEDAVRTRIEIDGSCGKYGFKMSDGKREVSSLADMYQRCSDYISQCEFLGLCSVTLGKLESLVADRIVAEAATRGEKVTKADAKRRFFDATKDLIKKGNPTKTIAVVEG